MTHPLLPEVADLARRGFSSARIAARLGMTRNAVVGLCDRNGIKLGGHARRGEPRVIRDRDKKFANWNGGIGAREPAKEYKGECRYIHGDPREKGWSWCGKPVCRPGGPYCAVHHAACHVRVAEPCE